VHTCQSGIFAGTCSGNVYVSLLSWELVKVLSVDFQMHLEFTTPYSQEVRIRSVLRSMYMLA